MFFFYVFLFGRRGKLVVLVFCNFNQRNAVDLRKLKPTNCSHAAYAFLRYPATRQKKEKKEPKKNVDAVLP